MIDFLKKILFCYRKINLSDAIINGIDFLHEGFVLTLAKYCKFMNKKIENLNIYKNNFLKLLIKKNIIKLKILKRMDIHIYAEKYRNAYYFLGSEIIFDNKIKNEINYLLNSLDEINIYNNFYYFPGIVQKEFLQFTNLVNSIKFIKICIPSAKFKLNLPRKIINIGLYCLQHKESKIYNVSKLKNKVKNLCIVTQDKKISNSLIKIIKKINPTKIIIDFNYNSNSRPDLKINLKKIKADNLKFINRSQEKITIKLNKNVKKFILENCNFSKLKYINDFSNWIKYNNLLFNNLQNTLYFLFFNFISKEIFFDDKNMFLISINLFFEINKIKRINIEKNIKQNSKLFFVLYFNTINIFSKIIRKKTIIDRLSASILRSSFVFIKQYYYHLFFNGNKRIQIIKEGVKKDLYYLGFSSFSIKN